MTDMTASIKATCRISCTLFNIESHHIFTRRVLAHCVRTDTRRFLDPLHRTLLFLSSTLISAVQCGLKPPWSSPLNGPHCFAEFSPVLSYTLRGRVHVVPAVPLRTFLIFFPSSLFINFRTIDVSYLYLIAMQRSSITSFI